MNIGVTGPSGFVAKHLVSRDVFPISSNITKEKQLGDEIISKGINVLIHAAALTDVNYCEQHVTEAFNVNVHGTMNVVNICSEFNIPIIYLSTDHVFNGKPSLYMPNEHTKPDPVNIYGLTKYAAEAMVNTADCQTVIVRSSKLFDRNWLRPGLVKLLQGEQLEVPSFIQRCFLHVSFFVDFLLSVTCFLEFMEKHDTFHYAAPLRLSFYDFWREVCKQANIDENLLIKRTTESNEFAPRPFRGGLDSRKAYSEQWTMIVSHKESIQKALREYATGNAIHETSKF